MLTLSTNLKKDIASSNVMRINVKVRDEVLRPQNFSLAGLERHTTYLVCLIIIDIVIMLIRMIVMMIMIYHDHG